MFSFDDVIMFPQNIVVNRDRALRVTVFFVRESTGQAVEQVEFSLV